jgi:hypothetical protein
MSFRGCALSLREFSKPSVQTSRRPVFETVVWGLQKGQTDLGEL